MAEVKELEALKEKETFGRHQGSVRGQKPVKSRSPVAILKSIRIIAAIAAGRGMSIHNMDVVTAFLNSLLPPIGDKEVLLELAPGSESLELGNVVKVFRALNGFKPSPREWNKT